MDKTRQYSIDRNNVLQKTYMLVCVVFANKEIERRNDPFDVSGSLKSLEERFFVTEASRLLIEIAIAVRVIDDQMKKLQPDNAERIQYYKIIELVDKYPFGLFDDLNLDLRQTCNKIIHSEVMEPHFSDGVEAHESDQAYRHGLGEKAIRWRHMNGYVRLYGNDRNKPWFVLLDIEIFAKAIFRLHGNH